MNLFVTAVSYAPKLTLPEVQRLRSLLAAAGVTLNAETRTGDSRFEVYTADGNFDLASGPDRGEAALAELRRKAVRQDSAQDVGRRARRGGDDEFDDAVRIALARGGAGKTEACCRDRGDDGPASGHCETSRWKSTIADAALPS